MPYEAQQKLDRFTLIRPLGKGAAGEVWLANEEAEHGFKKRVALKLLSGPVTEERTESLMREARIAALLRHPNILDVYGVGKVDGAAYIVMEYVDGSALSSVWKDLESRGKRLPKSVVLDIGIAIAEALHHAWKTPGPDGVPLRLIHRDLKPANALLSDRGGVKIADFGVAKFVGELDRTRVGQIKGTPSYLSPEQWSGSRELGAQVDMYALGVMLWEFGTGRRFYGSVSAMQIPQIIASKTAEEDASALSESFPELQPLVARLLGRTPEARPRVWIEVAEALRTIRARTPSGGDILSFLRLLRTTGPQADIESSLVAAPPLLGMPPDWAALLDDADAYAHAVAAYARAHGGPAGPGTPTPTVGATPSVPAPSPAKVDDRRTGVRGQGLQLALAAAIGACAVLGLFVFLRMRGIL